MSGGAPTEAPAPIGSGGSGGSGQALPESTAGARKDFIPELDGLRALAVLMVLWAHLRPGIQPDWLRQLGGFLMPHYLGVDLFFALSGFLITRILLVDRERGVPLRWFYARRFLRIFPIYYLLLLVLAFVRYEPALPWCAVYLGNYYIFWNNSFGLLDHTWSLCVEEHFYLLWPPLATLLVPRTSRRVLLWVFLPAALVTGIWLAVTHGSFAERDFLSRITGSASTARFGSLAAGALLAYRETSLRSRRGRTTLLAGLLLLIAWPFTQDGFVRFGGHHLVLWSGLQGDPQRILPTLNLISFPLTSTAILLLAIAWTRSALPHARLLRSAPLTFIGRISYGIYLYHYPLYFYLGLRNPKIPDPSLTQNLMGIAAIVAIAWLSYRLIERPLLGLGKRFRS